MVDIVIASIFHQRTPGEIAADYDIPLAHVHAALAYYYQHKGELDKGIREQISQARKIKSHVDKT